MKYMMYESLKAVAENRVSHAVSHGIRVSSALFNVDNKLKIQQISCVVVFHFSGKLMVHMKPLIID